MFAGQRAHFFSKRFKNLFSHLNFSSFPTHLLFRALQIDESFS